MTVRPRIKKELDSLAKLSTLRYSFYLLKRGFTMEKEELKLWMDQHGYTCLRLSQTICVSQACVYGWLSGYRNIPAWVKNFLILLDGKK